MPRTITFVALGDSLTVGFIPTRIATQPYSRFLKKITDDFLLQSIKPHTFKTRFINRGVNGDLTSDMLLRFKQDVIALKPNYVIILGGTNDMGWGLPVDETFSCLKQIYEKAVDNNVEPIGCTVPSLLGWDEGILPRLTLNHLLQHFYREKNALCVDLFEATCDLATKRLRTEYSSDGLHFNALGYKKIAETIFKEAVLRILTRDLPLKTRR
jgi:lysophospholipase L1-like esterase